MRGTWQTTTGGGGGGAGALAVIDVLLMLLAGSGAVAMVAAALVWVLLATAVLVVLVIGVVFWWLVRSRRLVPQPHGPARCLVLSRCGSWACRSRRRSRMCLSAGTTTTGRLTRRGRSGTRWPTGTRARVTGMDEGVRIE